MKPTVLVSLFLCRVKRCVENHALILVEREASLQFLADRNMSIDQLEEIILCLDPKDCFDGPEPDRDPKYSNNWTVAEFCPTYCGEDLYLKLSVRVDGDFAKCLSVKLYLERGADENDQ